MRALAPAMITLLVSVVLAGCITGEEGGADPTVVEDPPMVVNWTLPEAITGAEHVEQMAFTLDDGTDITLTVNGIWFHEDRLYTSGTGLAIVDIADPLMPVTLSVMGEETASRDVDIMEHPNGDLYAVLAGAGGVMLVNVTDPVNPELVSAADIPIHNIVVVPGTSVVYNSRSLAYDQADVVANGGIVDIVDFADPMAPVVSEFRFPKVAMTVGGIPKPVTSGACHDVAAYPEVNRAYCAGVTETHVWDITDPLAPEIIQVVTSPGTNIHHAAYAARDHTLLVIGDELGGALVAPGCSVPDQAYGGVWFIDISDLQTPTPVGWWAPEEARTGDMPCTAHFGNFIEDRDQLVIGFYLSGAHIVDFSDPSDPVEVAQVNGGGNVWEARYHRGYIYTGDTQRGVDLIVPTGNGEVVYEGS